MVKHPWSATVLLAFGLLLTAGTAGSAAEQIVVRTYNMSGVAAGEIASARRAASAILNDAGVHVTWRDCSTGCGDVPEPREVIVRIAAAPEAIAPEMLGCSVIDLKRGAGTLATVYADRIASVAHRARVDAGTLLGRAVAHEIGHMLLGTSRHSRTGLMRPGWSDAELQRNLAADWTWSSDDVVAVHRGAVARVRRLRTPAVVVASTTAAESETAEPARSVSDVSF